MCYTSYVIFLPFCLLGALSPAGRFFYFVCNKLFVLNNLYDFCYCSVHVYGNVCNVEEIERIAKKHDLKVIYDAAHTFGVQYKNKGIGSFGDASMFSFHATKVYNTIEGWAACYGDSDFGKKLYQLKNFGIKNETTVDGIGTNA